MCVPIHQLDPKARRKIALGNACLIAGIVLSSFVHPASHFARLWTDALCGFMFGISITINLFVLRRRRCRMKQIDSAFID